MGGTVITQDEKKLVLTCQTREELMKKYVEKFGIPSKLYRIDNIWKQRKEIREELGKVDLTKISSVSTGIAVKGSSPMPDVGETLVHISNKMSELIQINKDMLALFQRIDKAGVKKDENQG
jgi:hypothetical protein